MSQNLSSAAVVIGALRVKFYVEDANQAMFVRKYLKNMFIFLLTFSKQIPSYTGNPQMGTSTNSEDPDEMPHHVAFHQGLHYLLR